MNYIEEIDSLLSIIEGTVKGNEGCMITKSRGLINDIRGNYALIDNDLLTDLITNSHDLLKMINRYEKDTPSHEEAVKYLTRVLTKSVKTKWDYNGNE